MKQHSFKILPCLFVAVVATVVCFGRLQAADVKTSTANSAVRAVVTENPGETGEILIQNETAVGGRRLRPGRYRVEHVATNEGHLVRFSPLGDIQLLYRPVEIACFLERLDERVERTMLRLRDDTNQPHLVKLYIEGGSAAHAF